ncbi:MAG: alpha/beta hydrolase, partial [Anaerolineae bacterium]
MPKVQANGIEIYYELHGPEEAEVLVLSNGVLMSTASWAFQTPVLSQHYRLLLYDCRGMWQSDHPPGPYSMDLHADDLAALLDALEIERAHIGGTSYGAEISMVFAHKYPQRTQSLIVTAAVSQLDPLLKGLTDIWIAAARARDPE